MSTYKSTPQYSPVCITLEGQALMSTGWEVELSDPVVSYLPVDRAGRACECLPYTPDTEQQTTVTFTFRGEYATKARQILQEIVRTGGKHGK